LEVLQNKAFFIGSYIKTTKVYSGNVVADQLNYDSLLIQNENQGS